MTDRELLEKRLAFIETCLRELITLAKPAAIETDVKTSGWGDGRAALATPVRHYAPFSSSLSMAETRTGESGVTSGAKRRTTSPARLTRNFSKFHKISLGAPTSIP
jgi:hypothetical protein